MVNIYLDAKLYATKLANDLSKKELMEFFKEVHDQFYPDVDIGFMEYFLEINNREGEFVVHHSKLREYGVMTSTRSSVIKEKLDQLELVEQQDYLLQDVLQQDKKHGGSNKRIYHLTPDAFKLCLMRAQRRAKQPVDPVIYANYYLLLEKIFGLYREYQDCYQQKLLSMKDDKIDRLEQKIDDQTQKIEKLTDLNINQTQLIDKQSKQHSEEMAEMTRLQNELMGHTIEVKQDLKELHVKFDMMFDFVASMARFTLPMWIGSSVFKTQLDHLIKGKTLKYALMHLKVMFCVAFYRINHEESKSKFVIYFCSTNFADVGARIRTLYKRHCLDTDEPMSMLRPRAIYLISQEINCERAKLHQIVFDNDPNVSYSQRHKCFMTNIDTTKPKEVYQTYRAIVDDVYHTDLQGYQMRREKTVADDTYEINEDIIKHITHTDNKFFDATLPLCQEFINCYVMRDGRTYKPIAKVSSAKTRREDIDEVLSNTMYPLHRINKILIEDNGTNEVDRMISSGIINKNKMKSCYRTSKAAGEAEGAKFDGDQPNEFNEDDLPDTDTEDY